MTFKQFFPIPVVIAILAFFLMLVELVFNTATGSPINCFVVWIAFQAWAMYFMAGCTLKTGVKVMLGYLGGGVASLVIMEFAGLIGFFGSMAGPIAVLIIVVPVICSERVPMFDFVPAWFVGAGVFFGLTFLRGAQNAGWGHLDVLIACLVSCLIGVIFGIVTVIFRTKYEASLKLQAEAAAPAEAAVPAAEAPAESESAE